MPVYKDDKNGSWYVMTRYEDWNRLDSERMEEEHVS